MHFGVWLEAVLSVVLKHTAVVILCHAPGRAHRKNTVMPAAYTQCKHQTNQTKQAEVDRQNVTLEVYSTSAHVYI